MKSKFAQSIGLFAIAVGLLFPASPQSYAANPDHLLVSEVYYDTNLSNEPEEYVAVTNPTTSTVSVSGWTIGNGTNQVSFPASTSIASNQTIYITKDASKFKTEMLFSPTFEYATDSDPAIPQMVTSGTVPTFANSGGQAVLKNGTSIIDAVKYGTSTYSCTCWTGANVPTVSGGVIMVRDKSETTGEWEDTDTAVDFNGLRVYQAGQSRFDTPTFNFSGTVTAYTSPDSSYATVTTLFNAATSSIDLNVYEFQSTYLMNTLKAALARGVAVRVFLEGQPVGGLTDQGKYVAQQLVNAGAQVRFIINDSANQTFKRYRFDHAKYSIIDGNKVFMQSENFKSTGTPTTNTQGNRGWGIVINNSNFANYVQNVFNTDWNPNSKDSFPYTPGTAYGEPTAGFVPDTSNPSGNYPAPFATAKTVTGTFNVTPVFAPDSTFSEKGLLGLIKGATNSLFVQQLYINKYWGTSTNQKPDLYLEEVINAARRGVEVRVIMDSAFLDDADAKDNQYTVEYINNIAATEGLNMSAKLMNLTATHLEKVHNKGVIVDRNKVLVSSINWSENSPTNNREAGVIVENSEIAKFYEGVFWWDWNDGSGGISDPATVKVSEVYYDTVGDDNAEEYVELYNPSSTTIDVSGWTLTDNGGTYTLPSGTTIPATGFMTVSRNAAGFSTLFGKQPSVSGMTLSLSNTGDKITLKNNAGDEKDFVAWENYVSGWIVTATTGKSIYRSNLSTDTDTNADWVAGTPTP